MTRSRSFPIRFLSPPLALLASSSYLLPKTTHNVSLYAGALEKAYIPTIYEQQVAVGHQVKDLWEQARGKAAEVGDKASRVAEDAREKVKEGSGLKLQKAGAGMSSQLQQNQGQALAAMRGEGTTATGETAAQVQDKKLV